MKLQLGNHREGRGWGRVKWSVCFLGWGTETEHNIDINVILLVPCQDHGEGFGEG